MFSREEAAQAITPEMMTREEFAHSLSALSDIASGKPYGVLHHPELGEIRYPMGSFGTVRANGNSRGGSGFLHIVQERMRKDGATLEEAIDIAIRVGVSAQVGEETRTDMNTHWLDADGVRAIVAVTDTGTPVITGYEIGAGGNGAAFPPSPSLQSAPLVRKEQIVAALKKRIAQLEAQVNGTDADAPKFSFLGKRGAQSLDAAEEVTHRMDNLAVAREMEQAGKDARAVKMATGWERGKDGKWRYELDDGGIGVNFLSPSYSAINNPKLLRYHALLERMQEEALGLETQELTENERAEYKRLEGEVGGKYRSERNRLARENEKKIQRGGLVSLEDVMHAPELYRAYPNLRYVSVRLADDYTMEGSLGYMQFIEGANPTIYINRDSVKLGRVDGKKVLLHEVQHVIQRYEGFATGGSPSYFYGQELDAYALRQEAAAARKAGDAARAEELESRAEEIEENGIDGNVEIDGKLYESAEDAYHHIAGEAEARNTEARMNMTPEQRRATLAAETEDVAREDQIVLHEMAEAARAGEPVGNSDGLGEVQRVSNIVAEIGRAQKNLLPAESVYDIDDAAVPQAVRDKNMQMLANGDNGVPDAALYKDKVYLFAGKLTWHRDVKRVWETMSDAQRLYAAEQTEREHSETLLFSRSSDSGAPVKPKRRTLAQQVAIFQKQIDETKFEEGSYKNGIATVLVAIRSKRDVEVTAPFFTTNLGVTKDGAWLVRGENNIWHEATEKDFHDEMRRQAAQTIDAAYQAQTEQWQRDYDIWKTAEFGKQLGLDARIVTPSDSSSRYVYLTRGDGEVLKVRAANHAQPVENGRVVGGFDSSLGRRHEPSHVSIDPVSGATRADAYKLVRQFARGERVSLQNQGYTAPVKQLLQELLDAARTEGNENRTVDLGAVKPEHVELMREKGLPVFGKERHTADVYAVRYVKGQHADKGREGEFGQLPVTDDDLRAIDDVVDLPDALVFRTKGEGKTKTLAFIKQMPDGTILYVEELRTGRGTLALKDMRKFPALEENNATASDVKTIAHSLLPTNARSDRGAVEIVPLTDAFRQLMGDAPLYSRKREKAGNPAPRTPAQNFAHWKRLLDAGKTSLAYPDWLKQQQGEQDAPSFSRAAAASFGSITPEQEAALRATGLLRQPKTIKERFRELTDNLGKRLVQGIVDQYAPLKELDFRAYVLARMSKGTDGTFEAMLHYGTPRVKGDTVEVDTSTGGLMGVLSELDGEQDRFLAWIAANRAEQLTKEGREFLFTPEQIQHLKALNQGTMKDGRDRATAYGEALQKFNDFQDAVLAIAEARGLIDPESRAVWKNGFYVPFYRNMEDGTTGASVRSGLVNQYAFKKLKGSRRQLNEDLLANTLQNMAHLLSASAKNQAAMAALRAAESAGVASRVRAGTKGAVRFLDGGREQHYVVDDPFILDAITSLEAVKVVGLEKALSRFKHFLTLGVTINPTFQLRSLIRDALQSMAITNIGMNPLANVKQGVASQLAKDQDFLNALASGGLIRFNSLLEGNRADYTRRLIRKGVKDSTILDTPEKIRNFFAGALDKWMALGDISESTNRMALYKQLIAQGVDPLLAAYQARDLMDFSMQGQWRAVRFLTQVVPFFNARLQGLYKLGRDGVAPTARVLFGHGSATDKQIARRFGAVTGAVALASIALMLAYRDDDDWKKREDWDRDTYWWFKLGGTAFRIPKPFEVGAIGTVAERTAELFADDEMTGERFLGRLAHMASDTFSMNPIPQAVKPLLDVYANKDSFTGRPIESMGMERLRPEDRYTGSTSELAKWLGQIGLPDPSRALAGEYRALSPVQIDALIRGYFSWLGVSATRMVDEGVRAVAERPARPAMQLRDVFFAGNFVEKLPSNNSRYLTALYDQAAAVESAWASYRFAQKQGDTERVRELLASDGDKIRLRPAVNQAKNALNKLNANLRAIERDPHLSAEEKRARIDRIKLLQHNIARRAVQALR